MPNNVAFGYCTGGTYAELSVNICLQYFPIILLAALWRDDTKLLLFMHLCVGAMGTRKSRQGTVVVHMGPLSLVVLGLLDQCKMYVYKNGTSLMISMVS